MLYKYEITTIYIILYICVRKISWTILSTFHNRKLDYLTIKISITQIDLHD